MMMIVALDIHGNLLHVVMMDCVHLVWHVYDVMFVPSAKISWFCYRAAQHHSEQEECGKKYYLKSCHLVRLVDSHL